MTTISSPDTGKVVLVPKPTIYNGNASEFNEWIMTVEVYLVVHAVKFTNDKVCSLAILAHMRGGSAGPWAKKITDERIKKDMKDWFSLDELRTQLIAVNITRRRREHGPGF